MRSLATPGCLSNPAAHLVALALSVAASSSPALAQPGQLGVDSATVVVAPRVLAEAKVAYPSTALGERGSVIVEAVVTPDGRASSPVVVQGLTPACDSEALRAVAEYRFAPATRGGQPTAAKIRLTFVFEPPAAPPPEPKASADAGPTQGAVAPNVGGELPPSAGAGDKAPDTEVPPPDADVRATVAPSEEVIVDGQANQRAEQRSSSDYRIKRAVLEAAPHHEGVDVLQTAPGLYIARPEGTAVAHRYMLRGFDSEHGQDIEFRVAGLPINQPSHIHGQGYADLGFLIGETVDELRVTEGVHDPSQGDFAVAGTIDIRLGVPQRGVRLKSGYGSFDTFQQLVLWAPDTLPRDTFGALSYRQSRGFGPNRRGQSVSAIFQQGLSSGEFRSRFVGILYGARSDMAGVLRRDDIDAGRVGFYDVYPFPTAEAQNAFAGRGMFGFFSDYAGLDGDRSNIGVWLGYDTFRLQENFTGFTQRSQVLANVAGRGDLIEQTNRTLGLGARASYRSSGYTPTEWIHGYLEVGLNGRIDDITQAQNLLDATVRLQTWDQRIDAQLVGSDVGAFADLDFHLTERLKVRAGVRGDLLSYSVNDLLGNRAPLIRPDDAFIAGFRRSAMGLAVGPRTSVDLLTVDWLTLHGSYGEGYRSPQARTLDDGEQTPFTKVRSADVGARLSWKHQGELSLSGYWTALSDDVAFDATEGRLERVGATRRLGAVVHAEATPAEWLVASGSVTYVDAELREPPPASAADPEPAFKKGQNLPFVPPLVARADIGAHHPLPWRLLGQRPGGRIGLGVSVLSARPLPFGDFSKPFGLMDLAGSVRYQRFVLGLELFNLLNTEYSAIEYSFVSSWDPEAPGSRLPARHSSAGAPRTLMATLEMTL